MEREYSSLYLNPPFTMKVSLPSAACGICLLSSIAGAFSPFLYHEPRGANKSINDVKDNNIDKQLNIFDRRSFLDGLLITAAGSQALFSQPAPAFASFITNPRPEAITTVILDSSESRAGVQLSDVRIGSQTYAAVKSILSDGEASKNGVQEGMIVLGKDSSKSVVHQLKNGPYPVVLQFYNLAEEMVAATPTEGLQRAQQVAANAAQNKEPLLSSKGAGLGSKVVRKGDDCSIKVRRGDTVKVNYEARVASPGGPIYDSSKERGGPIAFTLGDGKAINGVEIGMGGMCAGEIKELDIPAGLGYGRFGNQYYDIPGDTRLWWRIELLEVKAGDTKFR